MVDHRLAEPELALARARRRERDGIYDEALGAKLNATFMEDLGESKQIDLEEWRRRNPLQKFFETISRILDQQS